MHHIYHTDGVVLGSRNIGEAGKRIEVFTKELGLVAAVGLNVRALASKLRYGLQDLTFGQFAFVGSRNGWRITAAVPQHNFYEAGGRRAKVILANVAALLRRLLPGEEKNEALYEIVISGFTFLTDPRAPAEDDEALGVAETVLVLRVLRCLGYVGESAVAAALCAEGPWNGELLRHAAEFRPEAIQVINTALKESHL